MRILFLIVFLCIQLAAQAQNWTSARPDGHAPIGVMGDHTHGQGEWMISYRYMYMDMADMRDGASTLKPGDVLADYMVTPLSMPMNMHMIGAMYAASDQLTLMVMGSYQVLEMDHRTRMGMEFTTRSSGLGDLKISGLYTFFGQKKQRAHITLGVSLPTGSTDQKDVTPASAPDKVQLPYPMQIGSGTMDLLSGVTYLLQLDQTSFGLQASRMIRLGKNDREYRFGPVGTLTGWMAYKATDWVSVSIRLTGRSSRQIEGSDEAYMNLMMVPTVDPDNFGGFTALAGGGLNVYIPSGAFRNIRLGLEYELPVLQDLNGPQMELQQVLTAGIQYSW